MSYYSTLGFNVAPSFGSGTGSGGATLCGVDPVKAPAAQIIFETKPAKKQQKPLNSLPPPKPRTPQNMPQKMLNANPSRARTLDDWLKPKTLQEITLEKIKIGKPLFKAEMAIPPYKPKEVLKPSTIQKVPSGIKLEPPKVWDTRNYWERAFDGAKRNWAIAADVVYAFGSSFEADAGAGIGLRFKGELGTSASFGVGRKEDIINLKLGDQNTQGRGWDAGYQSNVEMAAALGPFSVGDSEGYFHSYTQRNKDCPHPFLSQLVDYTDCPAT